MRTTPKAFSLALGGTLVVAGLAIGLAVLLPATVKGDGGIRTIAGGLSQRLITILSIALPALFAILFVLLRPRRPR